MKFFPLLTCSLSLQSIRSFVRSPRSEGLGTIALSSTTAAAISSRPADAATTNTLLGMETAETSATSPVAGRNYVGSIRIPFVGEQFFNMQFADDDKDGHMTTVRMGAHGAVANDEDVQGYLLQEETGIISLYPVEATKKKGKKKNNRLERIIYKKDQDVVTMVFRLPVGKKEGFIDLHRPIMAA